MTKAKTIGLTLLFFALAIPAVADPLEDKLVDAYKKARSEGLDAMGATMAMIDAAGYTTISGASLNRVLERLGVPDAGRAFLANVESISITEDEGKKVVRIKNTKETRIPLPPKEPGGDPNILIAGKKVKFELSRGNVEWGGKDRPGIRLKDIEGIQVEASVTATIQRLEYTVVDGLPKLRVKAKWGIFKKTVEIDLPKPQDETPATPTSGTTSSATPDPSASGEVGIVGALQKPEDK